jgi:hypothetical protein
VAAESPDIVPVRLLEILDPLAGPDFARLQVAVRVHRDGVDPENCPAMRPGESSTRERMCETEHRFELLETL